MTRAGRRLTCVRTFAVVLVVGRALAVVAATHRRGQRRALAAAARGGQIGLCRAMHGIRHNANGVMCDDAR